MKKMKGLIVPVLLGLGIFFSFLREVVTAYYFGSSRVVEIYKVAFYLPYSFFQSLGTVLVGALLPLIIKRKNDNIIYKVSKDIRTVFLYFFLFGVLLSPLLSEWMAPGFSEVDRLELTISLLLSWSVLLGAMYIIPIRLFLQSIDRTYLVSSTGLMFSIFFIFLLSIFYHIDSVQILTLVSVASVALIALVYCLLNNDEYSDRISSDNSGDENFLGVKRIIVGAFVYVLLLSVPRVFDRVYASKMGEGVIANLDYAMNVYVALGVLIGTSFVLILSRDIAKNYSDNSRACKWVLSVMLWPFLVSVVVAFFLYFNADPLVHLLYLRGEFLVQDAAIVSDILPWLILSIPALVCGMILSQITSAIGIWILVALMGIKAISKAAFINMMYVRDPKDLSVFGKSTLAMEMVGLLVMLIVYVVYIRRSITDRAI